MTKPAVQSQRAIGSDAVAIILVLPVRAIHPKTGGGQRSVILFEALKQIGDVVVLIIDEQPVTWADAFFPGARRIVSFTTTAMAAPAKNGALRAAQAATRFLFPSRTFAPQDGLSEAILGEFDHWDGKTSWTGTRLVVARYAQTYAITGLCSQPEQGLLTCIDIDDRDDQKIDLQIRSRLGNMLGTLARVLWQNRFMQAMHAILSKTSVVFLAKPQDRFATIAPPQVVVPNVPFLAPADLDIAPISETGETLLFVGSAGHRPNFSGVSWFLRACWPAIRAARPQAVIRVVGLGDWSALPPELMAQSGVQIVGMVEDLSVEYAQARAAICPIREGAGSQIKVIEACAFARPVVTTAFASGGFGPEIEAALCVATDGADFARACVNLLSDPDRAARQGTALHKIQKTTHSRAAVESLIVKTLTDAIAQARALSNVRA